ncbi:hypothetical protein BKA62DRAFT_713955 [Auriculariales sp. MPI-PUGE-AT-0066]|nr:hypothetical protein BKA62DRAFT_713955 [Auriculariales sp. MPI-PUGE-AT-0066]
MFVACLLLRSASLVSSTFSKPSPVVARSYAYLHFCVHFTQPGVPLIPTAMHMAPTLSLRPWRRRSHVKRRQVCLLRQEQRVVDVIHLHSVVISHGVRGPFQNGVRFACCDNSAVLTVKDVGKEDEGRSHFVCARES